MSDSRLAFLGAAGLAKIKSLRTAVVGAGGSGSHLVQQLAHLGVVSVIIIDPDWLERSNVNRVVMSHYGLVGQPKAELLQWRLRRLRSRLEPIVDSVESPDAIAALQQCDVCFGAVDHSGTRHLIEYFCRMAFVPLIDVAMQITPGRNADEPPIVSAGGRVVTSLPCGACFWCMEFLHDDLITRERTEYADGARALQQQVVSINGLLASQAITNMLGLFAGFAGAGGVTRYISYNALDQTMRPHPNLLGVGLDTCSHYRAEGAGWAVR